MPDRIRVLVVDDSASVRRAVRRMLAPLPEVDVVGEAATAEEALIRAATLRPGVVVLDADLPGTELPDVLGRLASVSAARVLLLGGPDTARQEALLRGRGLPVPERLDKGMGGARLATGLRARLLSMAPRGGAPVEERDTTAARPGPGGVDIVVVGASTGGPRALHELLSALPAGLAAPVVVAQHMPAGFTARLAERLDQLCALEVAEATDGEILRRGTVRVAPGGRRLSVEGSGAALATRVRSAPADQLYRPSIDELFASAADASGSRVVGVILTGLGDDGALGLRAVRAAGGRTLAESAETATVFGMPRAAAPSAERVVRLDRIASELVALCGLSADAR